MIISINSRSNKSPAFSFLYKSKKKFTTEEFIKELRSKYKDKFIYDKVEYRGNKKSVILICNKCKTEFKSTPYNLFRKNIQCPECRKEYLSSLYRKSKEEFISKAKEIHKDKYDYSLVEYKNNKTKVKIICKICNREFLQTPFDHIINKRGCHYCNSKNRKLTTEEFIERAKEVHKDKYNYKAVEYKNSRTKVKIICSIHGEFYQLPYEHLKGKGCRLCAVEKQSKRQTYSKEEFIQKAKKLHNDKYDYSEVNYISSRDKVKIYCKNCSQYFYQVAYYHLQGAGCPSCSFELTKPEEELLQFLEELNIKYIHRDREIIKPKEIDIYIPEYNISIEFNGLYWHSFDFDDYINNRIDKKRHLLKTELCEERGIKLFQIFENEWIDKDKRAIWKSIIKNAVNKIEEKIYARKCNIVELTDKEYRDFIERNHLQGYIPASIRVGLVFNAELVAVMSLGKSRFKKKKDMYELYRYAVKIDKSVVGGFSKLLKYVVNKYNIEEIISYADRRYTSKIDNVYEKNGFLFLRKTNQNYFYFLNDEKLLLNRVKFQKHKLKNLLNDINYNKSEMWNVLNNNYRVIFDCGNLVYYKSFRRK